MPKLVVVPALAPGDGGIVGVCLPPTVGPFAQRIYDAQEPIADVDQDNCWHWLRYVGALGEIFQEADTIARDGPPWSSVVDIDRCPDFALKWLAQFVGVRVPARLDSISLRAFIKATPNWKRGTRSAIEGATKIHLTGNQAVYIVERYDGAGITDPAYSLQVNTLTSETPDPDETLRDIITQKPAGIVLNYRVILGQTYQHLYETSADYNVVYSKYATYNGVFDDVPGE